VARLNGFEPAAQALADGLARARKAGAGDLSSAARAATQASGLPE
jgi:hypothetical protein